MTIEEILKLRQEAAGLNKLMQMRVLSVSADGSATAKITLEPSVLNPLGRAHGGTIFALCDVAAGSAAAAHGRVAVTLDGSIQYYRPGYAGTELIATARERKSGRTTATYFVEVRDENDRHIADATFTMFYTDLSVDDLKK